MSEVKNETHQSGYKILNVFLLKCTFERNLTANPPQNSKLDLHLNIDVSEEENKVAVTINSTIKLLEQDIEYVTSQIDYAGVFEKVGEPNISVQDFGHVNGAAMIFPFIREHLSSLAVKSGIGNLLLQPVNFVKLNQEKTNLK